METSIHGTCILVTYVCWYALSEKCIPYCQSRLKECEKALRWVSVEDSTDRLRLTWTNSNSLQPQDNVKILSNFHVNYFLKDKYIRAGKNFQHPILHYSPHVYLVPKGI